jgi:hypothetical protein
VFAVEKNPNAVVTLQNRVMADGWEGTVTIVPADMREWEAPELADILVRCVLLHAVLCCAVPCRAVPCRAVLCCGMACPAVPVSDI